MLSPLAQCFTIILRQDLTAVLNDEANLELLIILSLPLPQVLGQGCTTMASLNGTRDLPWGIVHARQAPYQLNYTPTQIYLIFFLKLP